MNNQAGKGPKTRKGANLSAYWDNYDSIFRKKELSKEEVKKLKKDAQIKGIEDEFEQEE